MLKRYACQESMSADGKVRLVVIDGEGKGKAKAKAKAKAFKAKSGIKISNPFSLGIYLGMITTP